MFDYHFPTWSMIVCICFFFLNDRFVRCTHTIQCTLNRHWVLRFVRAFTIGNPLGCEIAHAWRWWTPCMEVSHLFIGVQKVVYRQRVWSFLLRIFFSPPNYLLELPYPYRLNLDHFISNSHPIYGYIWGPLEVCLVTLGILYSLYLVSLWNVHSLMVFLVSIDHHVML